MKAFFGTMLSIFFLVGIQGTVQSQAFLKAVSPDQHNGNFSSLARQVDMFYDTATGSNISGYKQWKRWEWFAMHHLDHEGDLVNFLDKNMIAGEELDRISADHSRTNTGAWVNIGHGSVPGPLASQGRVNSVAFDPVNSAIVYAATAGGGMWKTFNNGDTWVNLTVDLPILGIADIVVSPAPNNHIVYALTGDVSGGSNVYLHNSTGVIKSLNGGLSWIKTNFAIPASQSLRGYKLLMDPVNPNILFAAMSDGIHRSQDGGNNWTLTGAVGNINDMEFSLSNPDTLYFTTINSNNFSKLNVLTNAVRSRSMNAPMNIDRMEIAVTPDNPKAVYLLAGPGYGFFGANLFNGLFYSNNSGASFVSRSISCNGNGDLFNSGASIAWYANTIYVDPTEENYVVVGGLNLFNSVDGGVTLNQITFNSVHADQHNIKRNPLSGDLWLCNDGGVYRSTNSGNAWENKSNGLIINEYYRISGTDNIQDRLLGGTQDNGHFLRNPGGDFQSVLGGDGMDNYFNSINNSIAYACSQNGGLARSTTFGTGFVGTLLPNSGDKAFYPWITPIVQHPPMFNIGTNQWENTDVIYVYSLNGVMRSTDGAVTWSNIGPTGTAPVGLCPSMVIGADNIGVTNLYISNGNKFWVCFNPLDVIPNWLSLSLPIGATSYISAIAVNPANRTEVWATITGYQAGTKVFRSLNSGFSWSNMSLSLPNTPIYSIVFANKVNSPSGAVYVGSEIGVFYKDDSLPNWIPFTNGLPHIPVTDLQMNYVIGELKCSTYGRGIWKTSLYEPCQPTVHVNFEINQGQFNFESSNLIYAYFPIGGGIGTRVTMKAAGQIKLQNGFRIYPDSYVRMGIGNCGSGILGMNNSPSGTDTMIDSAAEKENKVGGH